MQEPGAQERTPRRGWAFAILLSVGAALTLAAGAIAAFAVAGNDNSASNTLLQEGEAPYQTYSENVASDGTPEPYTPTPTVPPAPTPVPQLETLAGQTVWSSGDSTSYFMTVAFLSAAANLGATPVHEPDYEISSGLISGSVRDGRDWLTYLYDEMIIRDPSIVVLMLGANDAVVFNSAEAYAVKVGEAMDLLAGRRVVWLGQPNMAPQGDYATRLFPDNVLGVNAVFQQEAAKRPWVTYVDTWALTSVGAGNWGEIDWSIRAADGVHLTSGGGAILAQAVLDAILLP